MEFTVPGCDARAEAEQRYADLADFAGRAPHGPAERIYSIEYVHDGTLWPATVGLPLRGERVRVRTRRGRRREITEPMRDPAEVLAIFGAREPSPYLVVTDARPVGDSSSAWVNPFMAGRPRKVTRFTVRGDRDPR